MNWKEDQMIKISMMTKKDMGNLKGFCTIEINNKIVIRDCKIMNSANGMFVAMPSRQYEDRDGNKKWTNIVQITDKKLLEQIQEAALKEYGYSPSVGPEPVSDDSEFPF